MPVSFHEDFNHNIWMKYQLQRNLESQLLWEEL